MSDTALLKLEKKNDLLIIESQVIENQAYILDEDRKGVAIGVGEIEVSQYQKNLILGLTKQQIIDFAHELLEVCEMYLEE